MLETVLGRLSGNDIVLCIGVVGIVLITALVSCSKHTLKPRRVTRIRIPPATDQVGALRDCPTRNDCKRVGRSVGEWIRANNGFPNSPTEEMKQKISRVVVDYLSQQPSPVTNLRDTDRPYLINWATYYAFVPLPCEVEAHREIFAVSAINDRRELSTSPLVLRYRWQNWVPLSWSRSLHLLDQVDGGFTVSSNK